MLSYASMADLTLDLRREFGVPVVDGVAAAVKHDENLVAPGLSTAKPGAYAVPIAKRYTGLLAIFQPQTGAPLSAP